jgi:hypothetical protein
LAVPLPRSFLLLAGPRVGRVGSKILAKNKDLRIPTIFRRWAKVAATSARRGRAAIGARAAGWALRRPPRLLAAGALFEGIELEKHPKKRASAYRTSAQHTPLPRKSA